MKTEHVLAFGAGVLVGWLVIPLVLGFVTGMGGKQA